MCPSSFRRPQALLFLRPLQVRSETSSRLTLVLFTFICLNSLLRGSKSHPQYERVSVSFPLGLQRPRCHGKPVVRRAPSYVHVSIVVRKHAGGFVVVPVRIRVARSSDEGGVLNLTVGTTQSRQD